MHKAADDPLAPTNIELLGIEPLEEHARRLAALFTVSPRRRGSSAHLKRLRQHSRALRRVYTVLAIDAKRGEPPSPAAEWLLDNFHLVLTTLRDIRHDLPVAFFRRLPWIAADEFAGLPRIYAMALELIRLQRGPARCATGAPLRHGIPIGHSLDHGRAVGVAVRAEAGARRASANPGGHPRDQPRPSARRRSAG